MPTRFVLLVALALTVLASPARASLHRCDAPESIDPPNNRFSVEWMPCRVGAAAIRTMLRTHKWAGTSWRHTARGNGWTVTLQCTGSVAPDTGAPERGRLIRCRTTTGNYKGRSLAGSRLRWVTAYTG